MQNIPVLKQSVPSLLLAGIREILTETHSKDKNDVESCYPLSLYSEP
jgi:hypothetical protein